MRYCGHSRRLFVALQSVMDYIFSFRLNEQLLIQTINNDSAVNARII